jgi:hypothetical protein
MGVHSLIVNTYDIETFVENEKIYPYCVCFFIKNRSFYVYYENSKKDPIIESFKKISKETESNEIIFFVHNINFDGVLILETLFKNNIYFDFIKRNLNIYMISFSYLGCKIKFKCSYKMFPLSLKQLGEYVGIKKIDFPHFFAKKENLFYIGKFPKNSLNNDKNDILFNFKEESIKYCINDNLILKKILEELIKFLND